MEVGPLPADDPVCGSLVTRLATENWCLVQLHFHDATGHLLLPSH